MGTLTDDFADYLTNRNLVGGSTGWAVKRGSLPDSPDQVVVLYGGGGKAPKLREGFDQPALQVRVRGAKVTGYEAAEAKLEAIIGALNGAEFTINGTTYPWVYADQSAIPLGYDKNERPEFVANFSLARNR